LVENLIKGHLRGPQRVPPKKPKPLTSFKPGYKTGRAKGEVEEKKTYITKSSQKKRGKGEKKKGIGATENPGQAQQKNGRWVNNSCEAGKKKKRTDRSPKKEGKRKVSTRAAVTTP